MIEPGAVVSVDTNQDRFTRVANSFVRDDRVPASAFRVAVYVIGHAKEFRLTQESIGRALGLHRTTIGTALVKLEELGYARRIQHHNSMGRQPDSILVGQTPRTEDEWSSLLAAHVSFSHVGKTRVGKTDSVRRTNSKKTKREEEQPSGRGVPPAPEPDPSPEEDMPRTPVAEQPGLFEAPERPKKERKDRPQPSGPSAVVAAYVESYETHHDDRRPLQSDIGKVGRAAKVIMKREEATEEELVQCGRLLGRGEFSDLFRELSISRKARRVPGKVTPARLHDDPRWDELSAQSLESTPQVSEDDMAEIFGAFA